MINKKMQRMDLNKILLVSNIYNSEENLKKIDKIRGIIEELNSELGKEVLDKIMKTHKDYGYGVKYLKFLDLDRKLSLKGVNNKLNINNPRLIESWYRKSPPRPIITLLNIYFKNYHKISKKDLAYLIGWGFGDGGLNNGLAYYFVCGEKNDLLKIKDYLAEQIPKVQIIIKENDGHNSITLYNGVKREIIGTESWILYVTDSSFCKLLYAFGLPKGEKVLQETQIPEWIKEGNKDTKKSFLNSFFEGELQTHKVQYNVKRNKIDICPITFGLSKIEKYKQNLVDFLDEIRSVLKEFGINSTDVEEPKPSNIRKRDGLITYSSRFYISISALNTIKLAKLIDFPFNEEKRIAIQEAVKEAKIKIENMKLQIAKYNQAMKLFQKGMSINKISKELNIQWHTANNWLKTKKHMPIFLTSAEVINNEL